MSNRRIFLPEKPKQPNNREKRMQKIAALTNVGGFFNSSATAFKNAAEHTSDKKRRRQFEQSAADAFELSAQKWMFAALEGSMIIDEDFPDESISQPETEKENSDD